MLNEDFAACFTRIGPYKRDESMLVLLMMLDVERENYTYDSVMMREFGAVELVRLRVNGHAKYKIDELNWAVY